MNLRNLLLLALALFLPRNNCEALIVFENASSTSWTFNSTDPSNGVPWTRVGSVEIMADGSGVYESSASCVYLGNGTFLTANHVILLAGDQTRIEMGGHTYLVDYSQPTIQVGSGVDLVVFRVSDPGATLPDAGPTKSFLPLMMPTAEDRFAFGTIIGCGVGKSHDVVPVAGQGWDWPLNYDTTLNDSDLPSRARRWGTNKIDGNSLLTGGGYSFEGLISQFQNPAGTPTQNANEAAASHGDSGGGYFLKLGSTWTLAGTTSFVQFGGSSYYSRATNSNLPDQNYFVRIREYAHNLRLPNWKAKYLGNANASDSDDTDHDKMNAILEYALGGDPTVSDASRLPVAGTEGNSVTLTYYQRMTAADLVYEVWESTDLVGWTKATPTITAVDTTGMVRRMKASVPKGVGERKFLQLRVTTL